MRPQKHSGNTMKAMILESTGPIDVASSPLKLMEIEKPSPGPGEVLVRVHVCGVCHTELDEIEGRMPPSKLPMVLGHQVVGTVVEIGHKVDPNRLGLRVGIAWINACCGTCSFCKAGFENLCPEFIATGRDTPGGYAEYICIRHDFTYVVPESMKDEQTAPLLCAGAIGYRSLTLSGIKNGQVLGLAGFGASGHLVMKLVRHLYPSSPVLVFARSETERSFALELGAHWVGDIRQPPPYLSDAIIDTTPAWSPVLESLRNLAPNGRLVVNAIRKEEADKAAWLDLNYATDLWMEKEIKSVANVTRRDVREFLSLASKLSIEPKVETFPLEDANRVLKDLKFGHVQGAKALKV